MLHDALFILWGCNEVTQEDKLKQSFSHKGDEEIFERICEIAKAHKRIQNYVKISNYQASYDESVSSVKSHGLYSQALSDGLSEVLGAYKKTLIEVEGLIINNHSYTLSYIYSYVEQYRGLLNTLNRIVAMVRDKRLFGCQILSVVHQNILNGNEMVHESILKIFASINKVFMNQLCSWLLYGELRDPYNEFIIIRNKVDNPSLTNMSTPASATTLDKSLVSILQDTTLDCGFCLNPNMIPHFIPLSLAQEILFIGKTIILFGVDPRNIKKLSSSKTSIFPVQNYVNSDFRRFTIWEEKEPEFHEKINKLAQPDICETSDLQRVVREIKECVTKHLWTVAVEEAGLIQELRLMKDFFLLGRGELFLELLRLTSHILDTPTTRRTTTEMNHAFHLAARAVFLGNNADIEKFSFEVPYVKPNVSTVSSFNSSSSVSDGWSSIILKYNFKWPLHLLFTPEVLARYNDMFRLLLRIKKTQHDLHALWKTYKQSTSFAMCQMHAKLTFLLDSLQHYLQADVLETNFSRFMNAVNATNDFEKLKRAHATFMANVLSQSFVTVTASSASGIGYEEEEVESINNPVFSNIMELLKLCDSFCSMGETPDEQYYLKGYSERYNKLVKELMQLLVSLRERPCGVYLARLLMRLDYNRWLSGEAHLTHSVTNMIRT